MWVSPISSFENSTQELKTDLNKIMDEFCESFWSYLALALNFSHIVYLVMYLWFLIRSFFCSANQVLVSLPGHGNHQSMHCLSLHICSLHPTLVNIYCWAGETTFVDCRAWIIVVMFQNCRLSLIRNLTFLSSVHKSLLRG